MRVIEVKSCRECPFSEPSPYRKERRCLHHAVYEPDLAYGWPTMDLHIKTFPKFCPLKEAKS